MLTGERVTLRPVREDDLPALYEWRIELATWGQTQEVAPYPLTWETFRERQLRPRTDQPEYDVVFAVEVAGELVGRATLFHFDVLSRSCEAGLGFGPGHRGKGYGRETLRLLVDFAFTHRNLRRVHLSTLASNEAAIRCYTAAGFVEEGRRRESAWVAGAYVDEVLMSVLDTDGR